MNSDLSALLMKTARERSTDAPGCTGDENDLAGKR
jgi:hypothetical protein